MPQVVRAWLFGRFDFDCTHICQMTATIESIHQWCRLSERQIERCPLAAGRRRGSRAPARAVPRREAKQSNPASAVLKRLESSLEKMQQQGASTPTASLPLVRSKPVGRPVVAKKIDLRHTSVSWLRQVCAQLGSRPYGASMQLQRFHRQSRPTSGSR